MADSNLSDFIEQVTGESHLRVEEDLGGGFVRLRTSEAERRQAQQDIRCSEDIVLELLRNARDAGSRQVFIATSREAARRRIVALDDGAGIPMNLWDAVFEPRVTSKLDSFHTDQWGVHGRGMALFSIACNSQEHRVVASGPGMGTSFLIQTDTAKLGERSDQSSMPRFVKGDDGRMVVRGPRNINRIVAEFTLKQKGACLVYLGSPNEVLATLVDNGRRALSLAERTFARPVEEYPLCLRPALAGGPEELADIAAGLGLELSTRSARRVLDGQVQPLVPFMKLLDQVAESSTGRASRAGSANRQAKPLRLSAEDKEALAARLKEAYQPLARDYYLDPQVEPDIRITRNGVQVLFPTVRLD